MSMLGINPSEVKERENAPSGTYQMRIVSMKNRSDDGEPLLSKSGRRKINVMLAFVEHEHFNAVFDQILETVDGDSDGFKSMNAEKIKAFYDCFGIDYEMEEDEIVSGAIGLEGTVVLKLEDVEGYGEQTSVKRYVS